MLVVVLVIVVMMIVAMVMMLVLVLVRTSFPGLVNVFVLMVMSVRVAVTVAAGERQPEREAANGRDAEEGDAAQEDGHVERVGQQAECVERPEGDAHRPEQD